jgi:hypothetical protein
MIAYHYGYPKRYTYKFSTGETAIDFHINTHIKTHLPLIIQNGLTKNISLGLSEGFENEYVGQGRTSFALYL